MKKNRGFIKEVIIIVLALTAAMYFLGGIPGQDIPIKESFEKGRVASTQLWDKYPGPYWNTYARPHVGKYIVKPTKYVWNEIFEKKLLQNFTAKIKGSLE